MMLWRHILRQVIAISPAAIAHLYSAKKWTEKKIYFASISCFGDIFIIRHHHVTSTLAFVWLIFSLISLARRYTNRAGKHIR